MFKLYKKADILEKISDKVKTVDDLLNLPLSEFDRECCDFWFNDYLDSKEYLDRGYFHVSPDKEFFYEAFYLMECRKECKFLVLIEFGESLYFIFDPVGFSTLESFLTNKREDLLREVADLTAFLPYFFHIYFKSSLCACGGEKVLKPCVTPVLDDFDIGLIIDALDVYLEKLETENNLCASRDIRLVAILKQQLEGLVSCEDVQIVER